MRRTILLLVCLVFAFSLSSVSIAQDKKKTKDTKKTEAVKAQVKDKKVDKKETASKTVYVMDQGKAYHKKNCKMVKTGKKGISLEEAKKQGYEPCKICKP